MRRYIAAGNWKMHLEVDDAVKLAGALVGRSKAYTNCEIVIAPVYVALREVGKTVEGSSIALSAQNLYPEDKGAFTGEISGPALQQCGCSHVIIGHSERRHVFGESDELINKKVIYALEKGLTPIFCIGETIDQREAGQVEAVLKEQIEKGLASLTAEQMSKVVVAYEPVWAIGTGKTATPDDAQQAHAFTRSLLGKLADSATSQSMRILYGGSVKPGNVAELIACEDIDGALVGGASLTADDFIPIIEAIDKANA